MSQFSQMLTAVQPPRFNKDDLAGLTAKQVRSLIQLTPFTRQSIPSEALSFADKRSIQMLTGPERQIVEDHLYDLAEGGVRHGASYEECYQAKGGAVVYGQKETRLVTKSGGETIIPNYPVAPIQNLERKPGQDHMDALVVSSFDIVKGKVSMIRSVAKMAVLWPPTTHFRVSGFTALQDAVLTILGAAPTWDEISRKQTSVKGKAFVDLWHAAVAKTEMPAWLLFTTTYVTSCIMGVKIIDYKQSKAYKWEENHPLRECFETVRKDNYPHLFKDVQAFFSVQRHLPIIPKANLQLKQVWKYKNTAPDTVKSIKILDAVLGGGKRGMGAITKNVNYGPRMNGVWRDVNTYRALIDRALELLQITSQNSDKKKNNSNSSNSNNAYTTVDVRCTSATLTLLLMWLEQKGDKRVKILVDETLQQSAAGLPASKSEWLTYKRRDKAVLVFIDKIGSVPMLQASAKGDEDSQLTTAYTAWRKAVPGGGVVFMTSVYCNDFFQAYNVEPWGSSHDMKAIVHNLSAPGIPREKWYEKVQKDAQMVASWWHAPVGMYHEEGVQFKLPISRVVLSDTIGYMYVDVSPPPPQVENMDVGVEGEVNPEDYADDGRSVKKKKPRPVVEDEEDDEQEEEIDTEGLDVDGLFALMTGE